MYTAHAIFAAFVRQWNFAMELQQRMNWKADAGLLFSVLVWGFNFPILKAALAQMHPHVLNAVRFLFSALALWVVFRIQQRGGGLTLRQLFRRHHRALIGLGLLGFVIYQLAFILGIDRTTAGSAALIMAGAPLWTAGLGHVLGRERLPGAAWLALLVSLVGTAVVIVAGGADVEVGGRAFVGNLIMCAAAAAWGAYTTLARPLLREISPATVTLVGILVALPFLVTLAIPHVGDVPWTSISPWVWAALLYSGALSTGIAVLTWNLGVRLVGSSQTAIYGNLTPLVAVAAAFLVLHESATPGQLLGGALILLGVYWMRRLR